MELRPAQTDTKCITLYSFVPLVKYYHITYVDDDNKPLCGGAGGLNHSRVYFYCFSISLALEVIMFSYFQLNIMYPVFIQKNL